nr:M20/M25/M40 family metallo-hydrolase [Sphingobium sp.]
HLDGYGVGTPIRGDAIYNGAFDNASGVASLLEIARALKNGKVKPKRSILFAFVTAEEKGLLGSRYFARRPTVPQRSIVADLNFDMALPIFPLTSVTPVGYDQSSLGKDAAAVSAAMKLPIVPDPFPDRNVFIRSDQYAFIREGIPSLFFKYGFKAGTPEAETEKAWRANIYHSPFDDLNQPVMPAESAKLNDYVTAVTLRVANNPQRPSWNADSFFRRFAQ